MAGSVLGRMFGLDAYKDKTTALVLTAQESMYKILLVILTITSILWMSIFLYASFYYSYMPAISHVRPVHLQFQSCGRDRGLCTYPSANVTLTLKQRLLMVGQPYKVVVEIELPESPHNQETGMFMVCAELKDAEQSVVERSCRHAILHYKSFIHKLIATTLYVPFLLAGSAEEKQLISVELFSGFQEHPEHPAIEAYIEIQSQHIQIYQTYLKIHAHFTGLRYFMFHWPFLAAFLGISTNFFFLAVISFLSWYKFFVAKQTGLHVGYDANAAKSVEERRRASVREKSEQRENLESKTGEEKVEAEKIEDVSASKKSKLKMSQEKKDKLEQIEKLSEKDKIELKGPDEEMVLRKRRAFNEATSGRDEKGTDEEFEIFPHRTKDFDDNSDSNNLDYEDDSTDTNSNQEILESFESSSSQGVNTEEE